MFIHDGVAHRGIGFVLHIDIKVEIAFVLQPILVLNKATMARSYLSASAAQSPDPGVEIDEDSMRCAHPTFFSGCNRTEVVFPGMHALALAAVFSASVLVEWCDHRLVVAAAAASGLTQTAMHAARVGLGYVLMLAVMSDAAVLAAAVLGHAVGFVAFVHPASRPLTGDTKTRLHPVGC
ncbi:hypothetical protein OPV22_016775 [Ensete ventricosum]|uniref:Copper transporter n=1 Tax=Ensete ventricosum TaxID=4639 RepID=A0AAV8QY82_ENSVE|nr:hypothetical protein OPV22_016775 [Ensete ventricosum]